MPNTFINEIIFLFDFSFIILHMWKVGHHPGIKNDFLTTIKYAHEFNQCNAIQLWTGNPKAYNCRTISKEEAKPIKNYIENNEMFFINHSPYIINFAREPQEHVISRYVTDLNNIYSMGGVGSVLHMGFNVLKVDHEKACQTMIRNLDIVMKRTKATIILENMCGKGTSMCCRIDEWGEFQDMIPEDLSKRMGWCVDTAHLWGTGEFFLSSRREAYRFYEEFDNLIGWDKIVCFHFNGSEADFGSRKDLHADIGHDMCGKIEGKGMRHLARIACDTNKPLILEVPCNEYPVLWQINTVRSWVDPYHPMHTEFGRAKVAALINELYE